MTDRLSMRARRSRRARIHRLIAAAARSWLLESLVRTAIIMLIVFGMLLTGWGLLMQVGTFSADLTTLARFAGGGDAVVSSTLDLFRRQVLVTLGLATPAAPDDALSMLPYTGPALPTPRSRVTTPEPAPQEGFLPYQVPVDALEQEAPPLPASALPSQAAQPAGSTQPSLPAEPQAPAPTPAPPAIPGWIIIPRIDLDAPIIVSHTKWVDVDGQTFAQWEAPNVYAAGWQEQSALLGEPGNTVLNGHHNIFGGVFGRLHELEQYDEITLYSGDREFHYLVSQVMKVEERDASLQQRLENARWIMHSSDERLTLVTCWPPTSNTYRLIVVAVPVK